MEGDLERVERGEESLSEEKRLVASAGKLVAFLAELPRNRSEAKIGFILQKEGREIREGKHRQFKDNYLPTKIVKDQH